MVEFDVLYFDVFHLVVFNFDVLQFDVLHFEVFHFVVLNFDVLHFDAQPSLSLLTQNTLIWKMSCLAIWKIVLHTYED
jgi:hypothetical protein